MSGKAKIKQFILDEILAEADSPVEDFGDEENLTDSGILDSLAMLRLVAFLDDEMDTDILSQQFALEDFSTLNKICDRVESGGKGVSESSDDGSAGGEVRDSGADESSSRAQSSGTGKPAAIASDMAGKVVLVTGSSRGLGAQMARNFAVNHCKVVVNYHSNRCAAESVAAEIRRLGGSALIVQADVSDPGQVIHMFARIDDEWGAPDILVNNAIDMFGTTDFRHLGWPTVQHSIDVVVRGAFNCSKEAIPGMLKRGAGKIVNIGTLATDSPARNTLAYVLSKSALVGLTRSLAVDYAANNIQVNMVSPGFVETDLTAGIPQAVAARIGKETPAGRNASAGDVAGAVMFLASEQSGFVTGQKIMVTGGQPPFH